MAVTKVFTTRESGGIGTGSVTLSVATEGEDFREVLLPPGTVDKEIDLDVASTGALKSFMATCSGLDDGVTITIKTNSSSSPVDTLTFITPGAIVYAVDANGANLNGKSNPISAAVTRLFASNPSTTQTGTLRVSIQQDPTP
jgi:hypothetical protein